MTAAAGCALRGLRVLVVEDEPLVAMFLEDALARLGCAVAATADRLEVAMALAERGGFDAAVLDVNLARGVKVRPVADLLAARGVPFVFATGYDEADVAGEGGAPVVTKPYSEDDLARALLAALSRRPR